MYHFKIIEVIKVTGVNYRCFLQGIDKNKAVSILNISVLELKGTIFLHNSVSEDERCFINGI